MASESTKWLQACLRELVDASIVVDGVSGPRTVAALKKFQQSHGLSVDGVVGPATKAALEAAMKEREQGAAQGTGQVRAMAVSREDAEEAATEADEATGEAEVGGSTGGEAAEGAEAAQAAPAGGEGYVEKRVKVRTYGTTPASSPLLVDVPGTGGSKRLHKLAAAAMKAMGAAIQRDLGIELKIASGWRAHRWTSREQYEAVLVAKYGSVKEGKRWLAFDSPHETGLAMDIGVGGLKPTRATVASQRKTPLHQWLVENASKFGFHPYKTEPWHWEYPISLEAFASGVIGPDDPGPPEEEVSYDVGEEEFALEDEDEVSFEVPGEQLDDVVEPGSHDP